jgi:hypothetical protein
MSAVTQHPSYGNSTPYPVARFYPELSGSVKISGVSSAEVAPLWVSNHRNDISHDDIKALVLEISHLRDAIWHLASVLSAKDEKRDDAARIVPAKRRRKNLSNLNLKRLIKDHFDARDGLTIYPSDIAAELQIGYDRVLRLIKELENDGKISRAD